MCSAIESICHTHWHYAVRYRVYANGVFASQTQHTHITHTSRTHHEHTTHTSHTHHKHITNTSRRNHTHFTHITHTPQTHHTHTTNTSHTHHTHISNTSQMYNVCMCGVYSVSHCIMPVCVAYTLYRTTHNTFVLSV